jgi:hypothetical protein
MLLGLMIGEQAREGLLNARGDDAQLHGNAEPPDLVAMPATHGRSHSAGRRLG